MRRLLSVFVATIGLLGMSSSRATCQIYDGMQMPVAGMNPADYTGIPTCPNLQNFTYSTVWAGNYNCGGEKSGRHPGVDIPLPRGTDIYAVADGTVIRSERDDAFGWGNVIVIQHDIPWEGFVYSCYGHLDQRFVAEGDFVVRGQIVGQSGNTGATIGSGGFHLHFQIDKDMGGTHPYWFGSPNLLYTAAIEEKTHNPIPFIRDHPVFDTSNIFSPITEVESGRHYFGSVTNPSIVLYAARVQSGDRETFNLRATSGNPNLLHIYKGGIQFSTNLFSDEFFTFNVGEGGIAPVIIWDAGEGSSFDFWVDIQSNGLSSQILRQANLNTPETSASSKSHSQRQPLTEKHQRSPVKVFTSPVAILHKRQGNASSQSYLLPLNTPVRGRVKNPSVAVYTLNVKRAYDYLLTFKISSGTTGGVHALFPETVIYTIGESEGVIRFIAKNDGVVPVVVNENSGYNADFTIHAEEFTDTTPPFISDCSATTKTVSVTFSEPINLDDAQKLGNYTLQQARGKRKNTVPLSSSRNRVTYNAETQTITIDGLRLSRLKSFIVTVRNVRDLNGNPIQDNGFDNVCSGSVQWFGRRRG